MSRVFIYKYMYIMIIRIHNVPIIFQKKGHD